MIINTVKCITVEKDVEVVYSHKAPIWVFLYKKCDKCGVELADNAIDDDFGYILLDEDDNILHMCERCWENENLKDTL